MLNLSEVGGCLRLIVEKVDSAYLLHVEPDECAFRPRAKTNMHCGEHRKDYMWLYLCLQCAQEKGYIW